MEKISEYAIDALRQRELNALHLEEYRRNAAEARAQENARIAEVRQRTEANRKEAVKQAEAARQEAVNEAIAPLLADFKLRWEVEHPLADASDWERIEPRVKEILINEMEVEKHRLFRASNGNFSV